MAGSHCAGFLRQFVGLFWVVITHNMSLVLAAAVVVKAGGDGDGCHGGLLQHCLKIKKYKLYQI